MCLFPPNSVTVLILTAPICRCSAPFVPTSPTRWLLLAASPAHHAAQSGCPRAHAHTLGGADAREPLPTSHISLSVSLSPLVRHVHSGRQTGSDVTRQSPGRRRRLLRDGDTGFLFGQRDACLSLSLSFLFSLSLHVKEGERDTGPSVVAVHPSPTLPRPFELDTAPPPLY